MRTPRHLVEAYGDVIGDDVHSGDEAAVPDRTGLLIIRAWIERGSSEPLRAQVRVANDVSDGFVRELTFSQPDEVSSTVTEWLEDIVSQAAQPS